MGFTTTNFLSTHANPQGGKTLSASTLLQTTCQQKKTWSSTCPERHLHPGLLLALNLQNLLLVLRHLCHCRQRRFLFWPHHRAHMKCYTKQTVAYQKHWGMHPLASMCLERGIAGFETTTGSGENFWKQKQQAGDNGGDPGSVLRLTLLLGETSNVWNLYIATVARKMFLIGFDHLMAAPARTGLWKFKKGRCGCHT